MKFRINLSYNPIDVNKLTKTLAAYQDRHHNDIVEDFERQIKTFTNAKYVVALNTGTAAIHLALKVLEVKQGDYVLVSTFTYVASVNPIVYEGAIPFFVDSEKDTWNMDPALLKEAIEKLIRSNKKPRAIIVVHAYGMPAKMDEILAISQHYDVPVIEDAAEAIGSYYKKKHVGLFGKIGTLSFNTNKIVTTFGGGAILTDDAAYYEKILFWSTQARENKPYYEHNEVGFNYRMGPMNAAVGLSEWPDTLAKLRERKKIYENYFMALRNLPGFEFQKPLDSFQSNHWFSTLLVTEDKTIRQSGSREIMANLRSRGIEARLMWNPMHRQPIFQQFDSSLNGVSDRLFEMGLCLPSDRDALTHQHEIIDIISG